MLTKKPTDPTCGAVGESVFFDWQYTYTQPFDDIQWEKYRDNTNETVDFVVGKLEPDDATNFLSKFLSFFFFDNL